MNNALYLSEGVYRPELLFGDYPSILLAAKVNPAMKWKVQNLQRR